MIKIGFKLFAVLTVFLFFGVGGVILALSTVPPAYEVRDEIVDHVYPPARENVKVKFNNFIQQTSDGIDVGEFVLSEIELNAYLYWWARDHFMPAGEPLFENPYLFVEPGRLRLRVDIPVSKFLQLVSNKLAGDDLQQSLEKIKATEKDRGTIALTFILRIFWLEKEEHPYFYLDRVYVGVLPIPIPVMMSDYQDQFNRMCTDFYYNSFQYSPVYIRKIEVRDKLIRLETELKVTERVALQKKMRQFEDSNPTLARALNSRNCLYGCTPKEREALDKWMKTIRNRSANDVSPEEVMFFKMVSNQMHERRVRHVQEVQHKIDWRQIKKYSRSDKEFNFKHWPTEEE